MDKREENLCWCFMQLCFSSRSSRYFYYFLVRGDCNFKSISFVDLILAKDTVEIQEKLSSRKGTNSIHAKKVITIPPITLNTRELARVLPAAPWWCRCFPSSFLSSDTGCELVVLVGNPSTFSGDWSEPPACTWGLWVLLSGVAGSGESAPSCLFARDVMGVVIPVDRWLSCFQDICQYIVILFVFTFK